MLKRSQFTFAQLTCTVPDPVNRCTLFVRILKASEEISVIRWNGYPAPHPHKSVRGGSGTLFTRVLVAFTFRAMEYKLKFYRYFFNHLSLAKGSDKFRTVLIVETDTGTDPDLVGSGTFIRIRVRKKHEVKLL